MKNAQNNFTVENLVAKYRNYVSEHCPQEYGVDEGSDGKLEEYYIPLSPDANSDEQLLVTLYHKVVGEKANKEILMALAQYEESFYKDALAEEELSFLCEHFQEVVSYEFEHRKDWFLGGNPQNLSKERIRLVHEYVKPQEGATVFIADTEYCDLAIQFPNCIVKGFTGYYDHKHKKVWALGQIRMFAAGIESEIISGERVGGEYKYTLPKKNSVDFVIVRVNEYKSPGQKHLFGTECTNIEDLYDLLKPNGIMLFFSEFGKYEIACNNEKGIVDLRERIVREKAISSIVSYRDKPHWGIDGDYIMLAINTGKNKEICIKDDANGSVRYIKTEMLDRDIMWPSFYAVNRPVNGIPLSSLVDLADEEKLNIVVEGQEIILPEQEKDMSLFLPNILGENYRDANLENKSAYNVADPEFDAVNRLGFNVVKRPCVLLNGSKEQLKVGYLMQVPKCGFAYSEGCCLIPKNGIDVRYIAALLFEPSVRSQILTVCDGDFSWLTMSVLLDRLIVPNHNEKERLDFLVDANYEAMISCERKLKQQAEEYKKSVRMRKHALSQSLSSMRSMFVALNERRCRNNGILSDQEKISPISTVTVKDAFEFLRKKFSDMMPVVEHLADVDYSFSEPKWIDPELFIEHYIEEKSSGWLNFKPILTWSHGHNQVDNEMIESFDKSLHIKPGEPWVSFSFPQDALERIFDNIISNALSHGFTDKSRTDYQLCFSWHDDGMSLVIEIDNNGMPISSDIDANSLIEYGVSTALNNDGHNGIGCHEIDNIMRRYDGYLKIVSKPDEEFTVRYILTFGKIKRLTNKSNNHGEV